MDPARLHLIERKVVKQVRERITSSRVLCEMNLYENDKRAKSVAQVHSIAQTVDIK